jgi:CheY-like chemotaxis protein
VHGLPATNHRSAARESRLESPAGTRRLIDMPARQAPVIVVASPTQGVADAVAERLRSDGAVAYATHSASGCLRVATSSKPDIVLLDPALPKRLSQLLRAHPTSANAQLLPLNEASIAAMRRALLGTSTPHVAA